MSGFIPGRRLAAFDVDLQSESRQLYKNSLTSLYEDDAEGMR